MRARRAAENTTAYPGPLPMPIGSAKPSAVTTLPQAGGAASQASSIAAAAYASEALADGGGVARSMQPQPAPQLQRPPGPAVAAASGGRIWTGRLEVPQMMNGTQVSTYYLELAAVNSQAADVARMAASRSATVMCVRVSGVAHTRPPTNDAH